MLGNSTNTKCHLHEVEECTDHAQLFKIAAPICKVDCGKSSKVNDTSGKIEIASAKRLQSPPSDTSKKGTQRHRQELNPRFTIPQKLSQCCMGGWAHLVYLLSKIGKCAKIKTGPLLRCKC